MTENSLKEIANKHMSNCQCQEVYVTSDGQVFHVKDKSFANSHRYKSGGDLLLVKKEIKAVDEKEEVAIEAEIKQEVKKQEQPKKTNNKPRGRKKPSNK